MAKKPERGTGTEMVNRPTDKKLPDGEGSPQGGTVSAGVDKTASMFAPVMHSEPEKPAPQPKLPRDGRKTAESRIPLRNWAAMPEQYVTEEASANIYVLLNRLIEFAPIVFNQFHGKAIAGQFTGR
ncbi:MAG UNVERIFIED_CONTAM: hypothetical protein LVT10_01845 [Anaerolineae bacterium]|jgi:hypothetical protein